jgi:hypothetical protein
MLSLFFVLIVVEHLLYTTTYAQNMSLWCPLLRYEFGICFSFLCELLQKDYIKSITTITIASPREYINRKGEDGMEVKGCEKLKEANVIIAYELPPKSANIKTKFHDELYGRKKNGLLSKIPHCKLADSVIEIPQRNLVEVKCVFDKYGVGYKLRLTIPERDTDQIEKIAESIEDPYEKALSFDSLHFSEFVTSKLEMISKGNTQTDDLLDETLAISDTVEKWVKRHKEEPLATEFAYLFKALETASKETPEVVKRIALRVAESLRHWTVGYQILEGSKDTDSIEDVLKKYRASKK